MLEDKIEQKGDGECREMGCMYKNRVARVTLLEKLPFEQRFKGVEKISHAIIKARHSPCKA